MATKVYVDICGLDDFEKECREMLDLIEAVRAKYEKWAEACDNLHTETTVVNEDGEQ